MEKGDYSFFMHSTRGENGEFWESWLTVGFTVHRGYRGFGLGGLGHPLMS
jgi:hypothetical protein